MQVEHETERQRFVIRTQGQQEAELSYTRPRAGVLDLRHTFVPAAARGRGLAEALLEQALAYAREQQLKLIPSCPFVKAWLAKHPQHSELLAE